MSCGCDTVEDDSGGTSDDITVADLAAAARSAGTDIPHVVANIVVSLARLQGDLGFAALEMGEQKSSDAAVRVLKTSEERRYTLGVAYPAMKPDVAVASDGHRDFVSADVLEKTAWEWMAKHRDVSLFHRDGTSGHGTVVESYIWRGEPWAMKAADNTDQTVCKGDWLLGVVWDEYGWNLVRAGIVTGWSPEGGARRAVPSAESLARLRRT